MCRIRKVARGVAAEQLHPGVTSDGLQGRVGVCYFRVGPDDDQGIDARLPQTSLLGQRDGRRLVAGCRVEDASPHFCHLRADGRRMRSSLRGASKQVLRQAAAPRQGRERRAACKGSRSKVEARGGSRRSATPGREPLMKSFGRYTGRFGLNDDRRLGIAFVLASLGIVALLLLVRRPYWASPWLLATLFTFAVWRLSRKAPRA